MAGGRRSAGRTSGQWWESTDEQVEIRLDAVKALGMAGLQGAGASSEDADFLISSIIDKALQGDPVRGVWLIPELVKAARDGREDFNPEIRTLSETAATALIAGGPGANGGIVCRHAMELAIAKARQAGSAWVSVKAWYWNFGPLMKMAANDGLVAMGFNSSIPTVAPWGASTPLLGNAPTAIGIPAGKHDPVIVDMSVTNTSSTPVAFSYLWGREQVAEDLILDQAGRPTTNPTDYMPVDWDGAAWFNPRGSLLPLGGAVSGHKGYALLFAVNLLATGLSDTDAPWEMVVGGPGVQFGCQFLVVDPGAFLPVERFKQRVDEFIERTKACTPRDESQPVLYPGERSQQLQRERKEIGTIIVPARHANALADLAAELGFELPLGDPP